MPVTAQRVVIAVDVDGESNREQAHWPGSRNIGFTGTPVEKDDINTRAIFGESVMAQAIDWVLSMQQAAGRQGPHACLGAHDRLYCSRLEMIGDCLNGTPHRIPVGLPFLTLE